ncbi:MAG: VWA domain-containing protein [Verrucomicrobiota bacterium]
MLTFAHIWIFVLLPLPWLAAAVLPARVHNDTALRVPFIDRVKQASGESSPARKPTRRWKQWLVWIFLLLSLARPQWIEPPVEKQIPTRDLLLIVDLSGSMEAQDFMDSEGNKTDRLTATKEVVGDFLLRREGDRVGLVVFGSAPFLQVPFTTDLDLCHQLLDETAVRMAGPSTALGDAIGLGISLFTDREMPNKTIIALTDGNDTASSVPPIEAAQIARDRGITIHTIAMGNPETIGEEKLDEAALKNVAKTAGGEYFLALNRIGLERIYSTLNELETREIKTVSHRPRRNLFYWPLAIALALSALFSIPIRTAAFATGSKRLRVNFRTSKLKVMES